jgi:hypothetical protein
MADLFPQAIHWSMDETDIILLPFGFPSANKAIGKALKLAHKKSKVVFAPAVGYGFNQRRCYPASNSHIIGIHAVDGRGKDCGICAAPIKGDYNFSALGVCAESWWKGKRTRVSGPSYATAVAAGAAASLLQFFRLYLRHEDAEDVKWLCSTQGIRELLRLMSTEIDGYRCTTPSALLGRTSTVKDVCNTIMMAVVKNRMSRGSRNLHY